MTYGQWQDISIEARLLIDGALVVLVLQAMAAIVSILYTVWKWINGRKVAVKVKRDVVRWRYRRVWKRAEDVDLVNYDPRTDPKHPNYSFARLDQSPRFDSLHPHNAQA